MTAILFALLAGVATIAAPCTLPVLPVLLAGSIGHESRARPAFIALGFVAAFSATAVTFTLVTRALGLEPDTLRTGAIVMLLLFGILMLWPRSFAWLSAKTGGLMKVRSSLTPPIRVDSLGGFVLGATLGLVWTPCAGPVLGSILTLMAMTPDLGWAAVLLTFYAAGAAIPMLAIAYGGQAATTRVRAIAPLTPRLQQGFGLVVIGVAVAMFFHYDLTITLWLSDLYPNGQTGL